MWMVWQKLLQQSHPTTHNIRFFLVSFWRPLLLFLCLMWHSGNLFNVQWTKCSDARRPRWWCTRAVSFPNVFRDLFGIFAIEVSGMPVTHACWRLFPSWWCQSFQLRGSEKDSGIKPATGDSDPSGYQLHSDLWMDHRRRTLWQANCLQRPERTQLIDDGSSSGAEFRNVRLFDMSWMWSRLIDWFKLVQKYF